MTIEAPHPATYRAHDHDQLPLLSFLIRASTTTGQPRVAMRLVKPADPTNYSVDSLTPGNRLLYYFWRHVEDDVPEAIKRLGNNGIRNWHWIVKPGDPGYELMEAFKIVCDHRRGQIVQPTLLYRALGLEFPTRLDLSPDPANL